MNGCHAVLAMALAVVPRITLAQQADSSGFPNISCVDRFKLPAYPLLAQQARISGTVTATAVLSSTAHPERVEMNVTTSAPHAKGILTSPVEAAVREAVFNSNCGRRTVELVFVFQIEGTTTGKPKQAVSYGFPNRFWIVSEAPMFQPEAEKSKAGNQP